MAVFAANRSLIDASQRWVILVLALAVVSACGGNGNNDAARQETPPATATVSNEAPSAVVTDTSTTDVESTTAMMTPTAGASPAGSPATGSPQADDIQIAFEPVTARIGNRFSFSFTGLMPGASYVFEVETPAYGSFRVRVTPDASGVGLLVDEANTAMGVQCGDALHTWHTGSGASAGTYTVTVYAEDGVTPLATGAFTATAPPAGSPTAASRIPAAEEAMHAMLDLDVAGDWDGRWALLHPAHRAIVTQEAFVACSREIGVGFTDFEIVDSFVEPWDVAEVGQMDTVAVVVRLIYPDGEDTTIYHIAEDDGQWHWFYRHVALEMYARGQCVR